MKERYVWSGYGVTLDSAGSWIFDIEFATEFEFDIDFWYWVIIFVDVNSSSYLLWQS